MSWNPNCKSQSRYFRVDLFLCFSGSCFLALVVGTSSFLLVDGEFSVGVLSSAMATFEKNEVMLGVRSITITKIVGKNFVTNRTCIRLGFKNWH